MDVIHITELLDSIHSKTHARGMVCDGQAYKDCAHCNRRFGFGHPIRSCRFVGDLVMERLLFARFRFSLCLISLLLSACGGGGGGGGGGGSNTLSVAASPASVSVSAAVNADQPTNAQINILTANLPSSAAYIAGRYSNHGISSVDAGWNSSGAPVVDIVFRPPASLSPGAYNDQVKVQFCSDSACANVISGTTVTIPVSYQVLPIAAGDMPSVSFSQTQVTYQGLQIDFSPPPQINIAIALAHFGVQPYFTVDNGGSAIANAFAYSQSLNSGTLSINLAAPASVPAGSTTVPLKITACLDLNCVTPVPGSPFTVPCGQHHYRRGRPGLHFAGPVATKSGHQAGSGARANLCRASGGF
jgi:hypothetical protein